MKSENKNLRAGITGKKNRQRTESGKMKTVAIWKSNHPEATLEQLAEKFNMKDWQVRYAIRKHAELAETMKSTKKGREILSKYVAANIDDSETLRKQLQFCLALLENDNKIVLNSRVDLLYKVMRIRVYLQDLEIESHIKRLDADVVSQIIRRFLPNATNDEIIKIYSEEYSKWRAKRISGMDR